MSADNKKRLIIIGGPTASGKTALAIRLAKQLGTEIISADSRQFYREISIGTAKPSVEELATVPHHFIGHLSIKETYTAADYERDALQKTTQLFAKYDQLVVVGGSGLFIKALIEGFDPAPPANESLRREMNQLLQDKGIQALQALLLAKDPEKYRSIDTNNPLRLIRAIEIADASGTWSKPQLKVDRPFSCIQFALMPDRDQLYENINQRVAKMMETGLLEEVQRVLENKDLNALQTVGYKELFAYLEGKISLAEAVALIQQHTRNYAKRQMTWFRNQGNYILLEEPFEKSLFHQLNILL